MTEQLPLAFAADAAGDEFLRLLRAVVESIGLKEVAFSLDVQPSLLAHQLAGRNGNHLRATAVPWLLAHAKDDEALEFLAGLRGRETVPVRPMEPAEELAALKEALAESLGPDLLRAVTAKAKRARR